MIMPDGPKRRRAVLMHDAIQYAHHRHTNNPTNTIQPPPCEGCPLRTRYLSPFGLDFCFGLMQYVLYEQNVHKFHEHRRADIAETMNDIERDCRYVRDNPFNRKD